MTLSPGKKVWFDTGCSWKKSHYATIDSVHEDIIFITHDHGQGCFDRKDKLWSVFHIEGGAKVHSGRCFLDKTACLAHKRKEKMWKNFQEAIGSQYFCPEHISIDDIKAQAKALNIDVSWR